ncbi:hypothetical protein CR513_58913, partial [Mucuna pruriens]
VRLRCTFYDSSMVTMFIDTLLSPCYDRVVGNVVSTFADLVVVGERIELGILQGKFSQVSNNMGFTKKLASEKKKGETNVVVVKPVGARAVATPSAPYIPQCQSRADAGVTNNTRLVKQGAK